MGRYTGTPPVTPTTTSQAPIGSIAAVFRSGADYKAVGEVISRAAYPALSSLFPRNGSFSALTAGGAGAYKWAAMAYGAGVFVSVGTTAADGATSNAIYSRDGGKSWTLTLLPASVVWRSVIYANGQFIAVGPAAVAVSADGITWTAKTAVPVTPKAIAYGAGLYIAAGTGSSAYTSPDLVTWTARTLPAAAAWGVLAYSGTTFLIVSLDGASSAATSPDGITWTSRTMPAVTWSSVAYGNGLFVATCGGGGIATSPDGVAWTSRPYPSFGLGTNGLLTVAYGNGLFLTLSNNVSLALVSYDGITWVEKGVPMAYANANVALAYGAGAFANVSQTGGQVMYAENLTDSDSLYLSGTAGQFVRVK